MSAYFTCGLNIIFGILFWLNFKLGIKGLNEDINLDNKMANIIHNE